MKFLPYHFIWAILLQFISTHGFSQQDSQRDTIIKLLEKDIKSYYYDEATAFRICDTIRDKFYSGRYDSALNRDEFFYLITKDLRKITGDDHFTVTTPQWKPFDEKEYENKLEQMTDKERKRLYEKHQKEFDRWKEEMKKEAISIGEVKILPGNIGYLQILQFDAPPFKKPEMSMARAALYLRNTDQLIIDLRNNPGGRVWQLGLFLSYFTTHGTYLFSTRRMYRHYFDGKMDKYEFGDTSTANSAVQKAFAQKKLAILIDQFTFSSAEAAAYLLKKLYPGVIVVGEQTRGGYGSPEYRSNNYYHAAIPSTRIIDEERNITINMGGIKPDVTVSSDSAYDSTINLLGAINGAADQAVSYLRKNKAVLNAVPASFNIDRYVGDYVKAKVDKRGELLFLVYDNGKAEQLCPKETDVFTSTSIREVRFIRTGDGIITGIRLEYTDYYKETFLKRPLFRPESVLVR